MLTTVKRIYEAWIDYPEREGKVLAGRYRILRFLGMGSYGLTYLCCDTASRTEVVVKQAKPSKGPLGRELLRREIQTMGQLRHPAIPKCLASFEYKKRLYMVTEYVKGQTVEELIFERGEVFSEKEALSMVRRLMEVVRFVHDRGFVHLDLRIPNVMLQGDSIRLIDFGLASRIGEPARLESGADEDTRRRRTAEVSSDLYAVGHFLLFMLYSAFEPKDSGEPEAGWEEELAVSAATKHMIRRLLQIDEPYKNAQDFISALEDLISNK